MTYSLSKTEVNRKIGSPVLLNGNKVGIMSYDPNSNKLGIYSERSNTLIKVLQKGDRLQFMRGDGIERVLDEEIRE